MYIISYILHLKKDYDKLDAVIDFPVFPFDSDEFYH